jgi:PleD family two-component response regulator
MTIPSLKILLVDDDPAVLKILSGMMGIFGHEHEVANNGSEAIEKLKEDFFHIVLTDMIMDGMDGMELLGHIRNNYPSIKVIVATGYDRTFSYTDVIHAGASDFISKPFNADELEAKINRVIREIHLLRQLELLSISDALTGLYNRRYFDTKMFEEARRAHRQNHNLFLAVLDIDNLKEINDQHGHLEGDKLLKTAADIIRHCIRKNVDWPRFIRKFDEKKLPLTGLSVGLARFIRAGDRKWSEDIADLVKRADNALYRAKQTGRNRVVVDKEND